MVEAPDNTLDSGNGEARREQRADAGEWIRPVVPQRLSRGVVEQFRGMVAMGRLVPGQRLPNERELAEMFGVSRNSIREALRQLEMLTIIESRRGDGTYVRELDVAQLMAPFGAIIASSAAAVGDVLEFRRAFEPEVAALAATNRTDGDRAELQRVLEVFEDAVDDGGAEDADVEFHFAVARATHNTVVVAVHRALIEVLSHFRAHVDRSSYHGSEKAARGHLAIAESVLSRDPVAARAAALSHLDAVASALTNQPRPAHRHRAPE